MNKYVILGSAVLLLSGVFLYYYFDGAKKPVTGSKSTFVKNNNYDDKNSEKSKTEKSTQKTKKSIPMKVSKGKKESIVSEKRIPQLEAVYADENGIKMMEELDNFIKSDMPDEEKLAAMLYYINHYSSSPNLHLVLDYFRELKIRGIAPALVKNYDSISGEVNKIKALNVLDELNTYTDEEKNSGVIERDYDKLVPFFKLVVKIATQPGDATVSKGEFTKASEIYMGFLNEEETKSYVENNLFTPSNEIANAKKIGMVINKIKEGPEYEKVLSPLLQEKLEDQMSLKDEVRISSFVESVIDPEDKKPLVSDEAGRIIYEAQKQRAEDLEERIESINDMDSKEVDKVVDALIATEESLNTLSLDGDKNITQEDELSSMVTPGNSPLKNAILINSSRYAGNYDKLRMSIDPKAVEAMKERLAEEPKGSNAYKILINAVEKLKANDPDYENMVKDLLENK